MENQELLRTYASNVKAFLAAARAIPADKLAIPLAAGEWSPAYIIHHMADAELQFGVRYSNLLAVDIPEIVVFDEERFPAGTHYELRSTALSLAAFEAVHNLNFEILTNASPEDWNRTALHPDRGLLNLTELVTSGSNHAGEHAEQIGNY